MINFIRQYGNGQTENTQTVHSDSKPIIYTQDKSIRSIKRNNKTKHTHSQYKS